MFILSLFGLSLLALAYFITPALAGREMNLPPTNAFSRIITNGETIRAASWNDAASLDYPYAQISDGTTQSCISGSAKNVTLNTNDSIHKMTHSTTAKTNEIIIQDAGVYQIIAVPQVGEASVQADGTHDFWLMRNNVQVPNSNIKTTVMLQAAGTETMTATMNWVGSLDAGDIVSFQQGCDDSDIGMIFTPAAISPETPSIIISVARIS